MRISIKIKFSIFLVFLLLITVLILSLAVLKGIRENQQVQYEQYLAQQAKTANVYFIQTLLSEPDKDPRAFLSSKGVEFAEQLELISGQLIVLYDRHGEIVSRKTAERKSDNLTKTLEFALDGKTAYQVENDSLYYLAPLRVGTEQAGVVQFYYSLSENLEFYNNIKHLFIFVGSGIFMLSFILAYFYFNSFANGIIRLDRAVGRIREGHYETEVLGRKDEIGTLSHGIHAMSRQIMITLKGLEEEKRKLTLAVNKLSQLEQQQKQFIGNVTHEFKTPLTSIKAYIDLLEMYPDDEKLLETAKIHIRNETRRLYEMVEKVLQLSALEKYDFEFNKEKVDVRQAILQVLGSLKGKMEKFGITIETHLNQAYAQADKDGMTIILMNLMDNAIKYNKPKGRITIKNYLDGDKVIIEISDTGIGIPKEMANKVFEPFYIVDRNRSRESGGSGLGLSLVRKYSEAQGGAISLVSTGPEGSLFRISLPAYKIQ